MIMRRILSLLGALFALTLCACSASTGVSGRSLEFHGAALTIPEQWTAEDYGNQASGFEECQYWHGEGEALGDGGVLLFSQTYDQFGNTDTQMPNVSDATQQEIKRNVDASAKALDARIFIVVMSGTYGLTTTEENCTLEQRDGAAVWRSEGKTETGYLVCLAMPLEDRIVYVMAHGKGNALDADQKAAIDSFGPTVAQDGFLYERATPMVGKTQEAVMDIILKDAEIPLTQTTQPTETTQSPTGYTKKDEDRKFSEPTVGIDGRVYVESDDGDMLSVDDKGEVTLYNENGITSKDKDGSIEWTDGWGTVMRDLDGDGEFDVISKDSGESWDHL